MLHVVARATQLILFLHYFIQAAPSTSYAMHTVNESNYYRHRLEVPLFNEHREIYIFEFADNADVLKLTEHYCSMTTSLDVCFRMQDLLSSILHDIAYTPMLLHSTTEDNIGTRTQLIEYFQRRYAYTSYLEVGCGDFANFVSLRNYFSQVDCIDPYKDNATYALPSDVFFEQRVHNNSIIRAATVNGGVVSEGPVTYDVIFIDGLHDAKQVIRDVMNALQLLNEHGI